MTGVLVWSEVPVTDLRLAFAEAVQSGKITCAEIAAAKKDPGLRDSLRVLQGKGGQR